MRVQGVHCHDGSTCFANWFVLVVSKDTVCVSVCFQFVCLCVFVS